MGLDIKATWTCDWCLQEETTFHDNLPFGWDRITPYGTNQPQELCRACCWALMEAEPRLKIIISDFWLEILRSRHTKK